MNIFDGIPRIPCNFKRIAGVPPSKISRWWNILGNIPKIEINIRAIAAKNTLSVIIMPVSLVLSS